MYFKYKFVFLCFTIELVKHCKCDVEIGIFFNVKLYFSNLFSFKNVIKIKIRPNYISFQKKKKKNNTNKHSSKKYFVLFV